MPLTSKHGHIELTPLNEKVYCVVAVNPYTEAGTQDPETVAIGVTYDPASMVKIYLNKDQASNLMEDIRDCLDVPEVTYEYCVVRRPDANSAHEVYFSGSLRFEAVAHDQADEYNKQGIGEFFVKRRVVSDWEEYS